MNYKFKYKKDGSFFWKTVNVKGHSLEYDKNGNWTGSIALYFSNGDIQVIPNWKNYHLKLGNDWLLACKTQAEKEANTNIKLNMGDK